MRESKLCAKHLSRPQPGVQRGVRVPGILESTWSPTSARLRVAFESDGSLSSPPQRTQSAGLGTWWLWYGWDGPFPFGFAARPHGTLKITRGIVPPAGVFKICSSFLLRTHAREAAGVAEAPVTRHSLSGRQRLL